ncbi:InlB B-repeat-containing protein, partial [Bifidobacterium sp. SO1]|uniref:InlB B-repeat-containing protein n=1 Tax=Bifidobacterium sp. SO1 TaxID=2809029 RepID=UPI001BDCE0B3
KNPTRSGYSFDGWYTEKSGGWKFDFNKQGVWYSFTLYAHWTKQPSKFTVRFDGNGGSGAAAQSVAQGGKAAKPKNPTRSGYSFDGWYTEKSGGWKFDFNKQGVWYSFTLYAHWTKRK